MKHCSPRRQTKQTTHWYSDATELPLEWDATLPHDHFLKKTSLAAHQHTQIPDVRLMYVMVQSGAQVLLQAAFQVLSVRRHHISEGALKHWQTLAWRGFTKVFSPRLLVAGQLFRHDVSTVFTDEKLSPFDAYTHYRRVMEDAGKQSHAQAILIKDCPPALATLFQHHAPDYLLLRNDISMQMALREGWSDMKDYEKDLKHKYAQRYRNVRKRLEGLQIKELGTDEVQSRADKIFNLYKGVTDHQPVRMGILNKDFLPALKAFYGDELRVWAFFESGQMVAFASAFVHARSFDMFYIGFDYARNADLQLYFNILFFAIEQAIAARKPQLVLGRTALEAKARVGCTPHYLASFLYIRNAALRRVIARLQNRFSEGSDWEERHPFKT